MGVAKNGRGPRRKIHTVHKIFKWSEINDPAVRFPLTKKSSRYEIGKFHKKRANFTKIANFIKKDLTPVFRKFENVKTNLTAGSFTSDNFETLWTVCKFFFG